MPDTQTVPLFPLGVVLLPDMSLPLHIFEERYKVMITECVDGDTPFGIVLYDGNSLRTVGCTARVTEVTRRYPDGRMDIMTRGETRFLIQKVVDEKPYLQAHITILEDVDTSPPDNLAEVLSNFRNLLADLSSLVHITNYKDLAEQSNPHKLSFAIPAVSGFTSTERQHFLEMTSTSERLEKGLQALSRLIQRERLNREMTKIIGGNGDPSQKQADLLSLQLLD